jgi:hypothetical protein
VTVLEREPRVGGKCCSVTIGGRSCVTAAGRGRAPLEYFPHVGPADMATGYYNTLEGMQGARGTYYAGEVMSFASIEVCARCARALVARCFE